MRLLGLGGSYVPGGDASVMQQRPFIGNLLTSDPVRYARNVAVLEAEPALAIGWPTVAWADAAFRMMSELSEPGYPAKIRQPILMIAAGHDQIVSTPAIDEFAVAAARRLASDRARRAPRNADGAGPLPRPGAGGLRRLRAGHAAVLIRDVLIARFSSSSAAACTRLSPAAMMRPPASGGPFSQVVITPPAPVMIGISAITS